MSGIFEYSRVDEALIRNIAVNVQRGENSVLLGPPCGGKRFAMRVLADRLKQNNTFPMIDIEFSRDRLFLTMSDVENEVRESLRRELGGEVGAANGGLYDLVEAACSETGKKVVLLTRNVDAVSHGLARQYLEQIRTLVQERKIVVVMSGDFDLRELVHGPNSEFECQNQYVLQGLAEREFACQATRYTKALGIQFQNPAALETLWKLTGGNTSVMRLALWAVVESRVRTGRSAAEPLDSNGLEQVLEDSSTLSENRALILGGAIRLIPLQPSCWSNLEKLINDDPVELKEPLGPPGALTLSGITQREGNRLFFASPLVARVVRGYFVPRRLADLHATGGDWAEAFRRYRLLDAGSVARPIDLEDRTEADVVVNALCAAMNAETGKGFDHLKTLLTQGCKLILGFPEVLFWSQEGGWYVVDGAGPSESGIEVANGVASASDWQGRGLLVSDDPWSRFAVAMALPSVRHDRTAGVVVGDFEKKSSISKERAKLVKKLLTQFLAAFEHAIEGERSRIRLRVRTQHNEIIGSILAALGSSVRDVRDVLSRAASGLRNLGYRRVLICLVDPKGERVEGEVDQSDDTSVDLTKMTSYALNEPEKDIQPYVVHTRVPRVVKDAKLDPLVNQEVVKAAHLRAFVVAPILDLRGNAIGTIHIERSDMAVPSPEEVDDLLAFGRQLAVTIEQSERVNLLQSTLDGMIDPVIVVDALQRLRYANRPASDLLPVQPGWLERGAAPALSGERTEGVAKALREAFEGRHINHLHGIGSQPDYRGEAFSDKIADWRGRTAGAFVHIQNQNDIYQMFAALELIAGAKDQSDAMDAMLNATELLGHAWGRLYLTDPNNPNILVGKRCFGFKDSVKKEKFLRGMILSSVRSSNSDSWKSIEDGEPVVFRQAREGEDTGMEHTPLGLPVLVTDHACEQPLEKEPGEYWLDFPLLMQGPIQGKITLQCDERLHPESFDLLRVLSSLSARLLDAIRERDLAFTEKERWIQEAADKSISIVSHNIATRFAGLAVLLVRYQLREKGL